MDPQTKPGTSVRLLEEADIAPGEFIGVLRTLTAWIGRTRPPVSEQ
jgi:hypothetical protein